jgi:hypothetical protein
MLLYILCYVFLMFTVIGFSSNVDEFIRKIRLHADTFDTINENYEKSYKFSTQNQLISLVAHCLLISQITISF